MRFKLEADVVLVGDPGDGLAALSQAARLGPDVVLVDMESAGMNGVEIIKALRGASPGSAVVALSLHDDTVTRRHTHAAGATLFVSKHEAGDRLIEAVRQAARGQHEIRGDSIKPRDVRDALT